MYNTIRVCVFGFLLAGLVGCGQLHIRGYDGDDLPPGELAIITAYAAPTVLDGKPIDHYQSPGHTVPCEISVPAGPHQLVMEYKEYDIGKTVSSINAMTVNFTAISGHHYKCWEANYGGEWRVGIIDTQDGRQVGINATTEPSPIPLPESVAGTATVRGMAIITKDGVMYHAGGHEVLMFPKTPESEKWVHAVVTHEMNPIRYFKKTTAFDEKPDSVSDIQKVAYGYGLGRFDFVNVMPGEYYLLYAHGDDLYAYGDITIPDRQRLVTNFVITQEGLKQR